MYKDLDTIAKHVTDNNLNVNRVTIDACIYGRLDVVKLYHELGHELNVYHILDSLMNNNTLITEYIIRSNKKQNVNTYTFDMDKYNRLGGIFLDSYVVGYFISKYKGENNNTLLFVNKYNVCTMRRYDILEAAIKYDCIDIITQQELYDTSRYDSLCILASKLGRLQILKFMYQQLDLPIYIIRTMINKAVANGHIDILTYIRSNSSDILRIGHDTMCIHAANIGSLELLKVNIRESFPVDSVLFRALKYKHYTIVNYIKEQHYKPINPNRLFNKFLILDDTISAEYIYNEYYVHNMSEITSIGDVKLSTIRYIYYKGIKIVTYRGRNLDIMNYILDNGFSICNIEYDYRDIRVARYLNSISPNLVKGEYLNFMIEEYNYC